MKRFQFAQMKLGQSILILSMFKSLGATEKLMLIEVGGWTSVNWCDINFISHFEKFSTKANSFASMIGAK